MNDGNSTAWIKFENRIFSSVWRMQMLFCILFLLKSGWLVILDTEINVPSLERWWAPTTIFTWAGSEFLPCAHLAADSTIRSLMIAPLQYSDNVDDRRSIAWYGIWPGRAGLPPTMRSSSLACVPTTSITKHKTLNFNIFSLGTRNKKDWIRGCFVVRFYVVVKIHRIALSRMKVSLLFFKHSE